jgi:4-amino-4-deoxy-L-arabinose transferase-like glycosyltransferase
LNKQLFIKPLLGIFLIWLFLTAINFNKAFHADDTFHLEAAQHIIKEPLKPMSGIIRWGNYEPEPILNGNQPPLMFYLVAVVGVFFGFNEAPMHLMISVFSFFSLFIFFRIAKEYGSERPLLLTVLFGLCPAFVVNQNVMTDVPVVCFLLAAFYQLLLAEKTKKKKHYLLAMLFLTMGVFTKYIFLPVIFAVGIIFLVKRQFKKLLYLLIPFGFLILWSLWNYWEYGGVHILGRSARPFYGRSELFWAFVTGLGSISVFGVLVFNKFTGYKLNKKFVYLTSAFSLLLVVAFYFLSDQYDDQIRWFLEGLFFVNGLFILWYVLKIGFDKKLNKNFFSFLHTDDGAIFLFISAISLFLILFAPFMATRHILTVIPFILLLVSKTFVFSKKIILNFTLVGSFILSLLLGISDWKHAEFFKKSAAQIREGVPAYRTVWSSGIGGWHWYALQNGMKPYYLDSSVLKEGDVMVLPKGLSQYRISSDLEVTLLAKLWQKTGPLSFFSGNHFLGLYHNNFGNPPWTLSRNSTDTIYVLGYLGKRSDNK